MRTLFDSITAADIPADAQMVAGYVNGTFQWSAADWSRFPNAVKVRIATRAFINDGHVLDVETGDATPSEAPGWVQMRRAAGVDPTVYCNGSTLSTVQAAFNAAGVAQPHYWLARYDNVPTVPNGCVAKQYINDPASGGHYDLSAVLDYWPGVDSAPSPTPANPSGVELMERKTVPASPSTTSVRLLLSGSPGAAIVIRPHIGPDGTAVNPVWRGNIYAWGSDHSGVGGNPQGKDNPKITSHRRYELPNAVWCDLEYSSVDPFDIDIVG